MQLRLVVSRRPWTCSIFLACTCLLVAACDPGYDYRPIGWHRSAGEWAWSDKDLEVRMLPMITLVASKGVIPELEVRDLGERPIVFESSTLMTKRRQYSASISTKALRYRTVKPGAMLRIPLYFDFDGPAYEVLEKSVEISVTYRIGEDQPRILHIRLVRD